MTRKITTNRLPRCTWKKAAAFAAIGLTSAAASATNLTTNPGFLDIDEDLAFGDSWGSFGAIAFLDFFNESTFFKRFKGLTFLLSTLISLPVSNLCLLVESLFFRLTFINESFCFCSE